MVESTGFQSQLQEPILSNHTNEFWLNETGLSVDDSIYIYIYIPSNCIDWKMKTYWYLSQKAIILDKSSRRHSVSAHSWWISVFASQPTLVCPCVGVHGRRSFTKQCPAYLARLEWFVNDRTAAVLWSYASRCCLKFALNILVQFCHCWEEFSFYSIRDIREPYGHKIINSNQYLENTY